MQSKKRRQELEKKKTQKKWLSRHPCRRRAIPARYDLEDSGTTFILAVNQVSIRTVNLPDQVAISAAPGSRLKRAQRQRHGVQLDVSGPLREIDEVASVIRGHSVVTS